MQNRGVAVIKNINGDVPDGYLQKVLENQTSVGVAAQHLDGHLEIARAPMTLDLSGAQSFNEKFKGREFIMFLQSGLGAVQEDDIGPYTLIENSDGLPILAAFLDGNFHQFERDESSHSAQFFAVQEELIERVKRFYNMHNGDLQATLNDMGQDRLFAKDIANLMVGDSGSIVLYGAVSEPLIFSIGDRHKEFPWGWTSNMLGYGEKAKTAADALFGSTAPAKAKTEIKADVKPQTPTRALGTPTRPKPTVASTNPVVAPVVSPVPGAAPDVAPVVDPSSPPGVKFDPEEILTLTVPPSLAGQHKQKAKWLRKRIPGENLPKDAMNLKEIKCTRGTATQTFMSEYNKTLGLKAVASAVTVEPKVTPVPKTDTVIPKPASVPSVAPPKVEPQKAAPVVENKKPQRPVSQAPAAKENGYPPRAEAAPQKDTDAHHVNGGVTDMPIALIPHGQKHKILTTIESASFKEAVDRQSQLMADPINFQKLEDKIPTFSDQLGLKDLEDTLAWPFEEILKMAKDNPAAIAVLATSWRSRCMDWKKTAAEAIDAIPVPEKKVEPQRIAANGGGVQVTRRPQRPGR